MVIKVPLSTTLGINFSPLNIRLPQLTGYAKHFSDENKVIHFLVSDKKLLKKYIKIWGKIKSLFKKEFDKNPAYENKYITAKLNNTKFEHRILRNNERHDIPIEPKNNNRQEYLSVILLDSILIYPEIYCLNKYYPQIFLKKYIYTKDKETEFLDRCIC